MNKNDLEEFKRFFNNTEKLYHYTKYTSALKILESNTLLFGFPKKMNDLKELHRYIEVPRLFTYNDKLYEKYCKEAISDYNQYQQLSLTMDRKRGRLGFDISAMWAHYAEYGKGICFVFNKNELLDCVNANDFGSNSICDKVAYRKQYSNHVFYDLVDGRVELNKKSRKAAFFRKTNDWSYEQEFRIVKKADSKRRIDINYGDSLLAVIMHRPKHLGYEEAICKSAEYRRLHSILGDNIPILEYSFWFGNSSLALDGLTIWSTERVNYEKVKLDC